MPSPKPTLAAPALRRLRLDASCLLLVMALAPWGPALAATPSARELEQQARNGQRPQVLQRLDQLLADQPGEASLRFLRAVLLAESGRPADAAAAYERMTQDFPELPEPHNNLAVLRAAAGQLDQARTLLDTALRLAPDYRVARENLGDVLVQMALRAYGEAAAGTSPEPALRAKLSGLRQMLPNR